MKDEREEEVIQQRSQRREALIEGVEKQRKLLEEAGEERQKLYEETKEKLEAFYQVTGNAYYRIGYLEDTEANEIRAERDEETQERVRAEERALLFEAVEARERLFTEMSRRLQQRYEETGNIYLTLSLEEYVATKEEQNRVVVALMCDNCWGDTNNNTGDGAGGVDWDELD